MPTQWNWIRSKNEDFQRVGEFGLDPWGARAERLSILAKELQALTEANVAAGAYTSSDPDDDE